MRYKPFHLLALGMLIIVMLACSMPLGDNAKTPTPTLTGTTEATASPPPTLTPNAPTETATVTATLTPTVTKTDIPTPCNRARFISDVNYADGTEVDAGESFTKTWSLQNSGSCTWAADYRLVFVSGDSMSAPDSSAFTNSSVAPNATTNVSVNLKAPASAGTYKGYFKLRAPDGTLFGVGNDGSTSFYVEIVVVEQAAAQNPPSPSIPPLNRTLRLTNPPMKGLDVKQLQKRLLDLDYDVVGTADGTFGTKTDKGVRAFQSDEGLIVDGIVGEKTWKALWK